MRLNNLATWVGSFDERLLGPPNCVSKMPWTWQQFEITLFGVQLTDRRDHLSDLMLNLVEANHVGDTTKTYHPNPSFRSTLKLMYWETN